MKIAIPFFVAMHMVHYYKIVSLTRLDFRQHKDGGAMVKVKDKLRLLKPSLSKSSGSPEHVAIVPLQVTRFPAMFSNPRSTSHASYNVLTTLHPRKHPN